MKRLPGLQVDAYQPLLKQLDEVEVGSVLQRLSKARESAAFQRDERKFDRGGLIALSAAGIAGGVWAAVSGHPLIASAAGLAAVGTGFFGLRAHSQVKKLNAEYELTNSVHQAAEKAADEVANSLVVDGPGPDQITDRRYYTGGIITGVATVHSRESGALLRTQVELGGAVPRKLEANVSKGTVSVRSPQGDQSFSGALDVSHSTVTIRSNFAQGKTEGPITQTIHPDGSSQLELHVDRAYSQTLSTKNALPEEGFVSSTYAWENGQAAAYTRNDYSMGPNLTVANPVVPLQDLKPTAVRVLPEGVIGVNSKVSGAFQADEASLPTSKGIGTWSSVNQPDLTTRLIEMSFGGDAFRVTSDLKLGTTRVTAADGSHVDSQADLIVINKTYRMQNQHVLGTLEQSLLPKEVLLTLQNGSRTLCVQHKSGQEPRAVEQEDKDFLEDVKSLPITLDDNGTYWVKDGTQQIEMKPMMPLSFLEKEAPAKS
ncbi:hypothetical protein JST97_15375 [bacterium]|nr:hypothetical protein [bacterium]